MGPIRLALILCFFAAHNSHSRKIPMTQPGADEHQEGRVEPWQNTVHTHTIWKREDDNSVDGSGNNKKDGLGGLFDGLGLIFDVARGFLTGLGNFHEKVIKPVKKTIGTTIKALSESKVLDSLIKTKTNILNSIVKTKVQLADSVVKTVPHVSRALDSVVKFKSDLIGGGMCLLFCRLSPTEEERAACKRQHCPRRRRKQQQKQKENDVTL